MENLDFPQAVEEIKQAANWLREQGAPKVRMTVSVVQAVCVASNYCKMSSIQLQQISQVGLHMSDLPSHEGWNTQMTSARLYSLYLSCISCRNVAWEYCCSAAWAQTCALHSSEMHMTAFLKQRQSSTCYTWSVLKLFRSFGGHINIISTLTRTACKFLLHDCRATLHACSLLLLSYICTSPSIIPQMG